MSIFPTAMLKNIIPLLPVKFNNYIEPFFARGDLFYYLASAGMLTPKQVHLNTDDNDLALTCSFMSWASHEIMITCREIAEAYRVAGAVGDIQVRSEFIAQLRIELDSKTQHPKKQAMLPTLKGKDRAATFLMANLLSKDGLELDEAVSLDEAIESIPKAGNIFRRYEPLITNDDWRDIDPEPGDLVYFGPPVMSPKDKEELIELAETFAANDIYTIIR